MENIIHIPDWSKENEGSFFHPYSVESLLRLEGQIAAISARMVKTVPELLDQEINSSLETLLHAVNVERVGLLEIDDKQPQARVAYASYAEGIEAVSGEIDLAELFPWSYQCLVKKRKTLAIARIAGLPQEAELDRQSFGSMKVKSSLAIPLCTSDRVHHIIVVHSLDREVIWQQEFIVRLRLVGEIFISALRQRETIRELQISRNRLELATSSAGAGIWELNVNNGNIWATDNTRQLFSFSLDEDLTIESFISRVHPEDQENLREIIDRSIRLREKIYAEYRIIEPDGKVRWMLSKGKFQHVEGLEYQYLMGITQEITARKTMEKKLHENLQEIELLRQQLEKENTLLKEEADKSANTHSPLGTSQAMRNIMRKIEQVAATESTVLIQGETGTGKELIAQAIHRLSDRGKRLMVTVNCAALPGALVESELFGRERGAFTGAVSKQVGRFELANNSTLFLDEIAEMPLETQAKLLRVLQEGVFERLGSPYSVKVDVRIIAATNRNLLKEVENGRFRRDLFYRLNIFPIQVPPLRERTEDIPQLVWKFVSELGGKMGKRINRVPNRDMEILASYSWPGNIRELRNVIEHGLIVSKGEVLELSLKQLELRVKQNDRATPTLEEVERDHIQGVLRLTMGRIKGKGGAAQLLGLNPSTLYSRMRKLDITQNRA